MLGVVPQMHVVLQELLALLPQDGFVLSQPAGLMPRQLRQERAGARLSALAPLAQEAQRL